MKYEEWLEQWIENYIKPVSKPKTYTRYAEIVRRHIIPQLGMLGLDEVTPLVIQRYVTYLSAHGNLRTGAGLAPSSVNAVITVMQSSLGTAHALGYVDAYAGKSIKRPRTHKARAECFSIIEQKRIEAYVLDGPARLFGILLCLYTGMRIGELLALEWSDVDLGRGEISITKTAHEGRDKDGVFRRIVNSPKTASSVRTIPIARRLIPLMEEHKKNSRSIYVISSGSKPVSTRAYQRSFSLVLSRLGIPHRGFHYLRHAFATRALECGMDVKTLSEILGHRNPNVTLTRYVHSMMEHKREMVDRLGNLL